MHETGQCRAGHGHAAEGESGLTFIAEWRYVLNWADFHSVTFAKEMMFSPLSVCLWFYVIVCL